MNVITFFSQKGGSGKTTLAVHCAVAASAAGESVAVIDADPQGSAAAWSGARQAQTPVVAVCDASRIRQAIAAARADGHTLAIIDAPPHAKASAAELLTIADLVVIPVRPTVLDLAALPQAVQLVTAATRPALFVLSAAKPRLAEVAEVRDALRDGYGWPVAETVIHDRAAFARALANGQAVAEFEPRGTAAQEIAALWSEVAAHVKTPKRQNVTTE